MKVLRIQAAGLKWMQQNPTVQRNPCDPILPAETINFQYWNNNENEDDLPLAPIGTNIVLTPPANDSTIQGWPRKLILHMDNCAGDNKNQIVFGFLAMLVRRKCFQSIKLQFGLPNHGHAQ